MAKCIRKIALMYQMFGKAEGLHICKECGNFVTGRYHNKVYRKCKVYGLTHSEASDWANKYEACGMFNKEYKGRSVIDFVNRNKQREADSMEGQLTIEGVEKNA